MTNFLTVTTPANPDDEQRRILKRAQAEAWVRTYMKIAIGIVLAVSLVPGAATAALCSLEATLCLHIGRIYRGNAWTIADGQMAAKAIGIAALAGPIAAMEATILLGPFAFAAKPAVAALIVRGMGQLVIRYFEERE